MSDIDTAQVEFFDIDEALQEAHEELSQACCSRIDCTLCVFLTFGSVVYLALVYWYQ